MCVRKDMPLKLFQKFSVTICDRAKQGKNVLLFCKLLIQDLKSRNAEKPFEKIQT